LAGAGIISLRHRVQTGSRTHSASYPMGTGGLFPPEVKQPGREADHSPPSSVEVKNACCYTSTPHVFKAWCFVKQSDNFILSSPYHPILNLIDIR